MIVPRRRAESRPGGAGEGTAHGKVDPIHRMRTNGEATLALVHAEQKGQALKELSNMATPHRTLGQSDNIKAELYSNERCSRWAKAH